PSSSFSSTPRRPPPAALFPYTTLFRSVADEVFTTQRLRARRWRDSDLEPLLIVYGDVDAMRWVGDGSPLPSDGAEKWLEITRARSEEHTSELQSREQLVCRLLLEKKKH